MQIKLKPGLIVLPAVLLFLVGCGKTPEPPPAADITYYVRAGGFVTNHDGFFVELARVIDGDMSGRSRVPDARITVNGGGRAELPEGISIYQGTLDAPLSAGEPINLEITIGDVTISGTNTVPETVTVTNPSDGAVFTGADAVVFEWTTSEPADRYLFYIQFHDAAGGVAGNTWDYENNGSATQHELQIRDDQLNGNPMRVQVIPSNSGEFSGPVEASSAFTSENRIAPMVEITVNR